MATDADVEAAARAWYEATEADNPTATRWDDEWPTDTLWLREEYRARARRFLAAMPSRSDDGWRTIDSAPSDGRRALVYRPLAANSGDTPVTIKRLVGGNHHCWDSTVPAGQTPTNPTDGACHVTHWRPLPPPPDGRALKEENNG